MKNKHLYILLDIIRKNGDIRKLKREGIDYKEIAELTKYAITEKLVTYEKDIISLSESGKLKVENLENEFKIKNKDLWIEPENKSRIPKLDKNFIFLPNQNEIHF